MTELTGELLAMASNLALLFASMPTSEMLCALDQTGDRARAILCSFFRPEIAAAAALATATMARHKIAAAAGQQNESGLE